MPLPHALYPLSSCREVIFLKNVITNPNIVVGDYTYFHDLDHPERFERRNVIFALRDCKLIIGKFCQIAHGVKFLMSDANHPLDGFSTFPFFIFGQEWAQYTPNLRQKGDTVIGNDVWFGRESVILPGVTIADGAIIGACSVVTKDVPPYAVVAGNPAKIVKKRFDATIVKELLEIGWWHWDEEKITRNLSAIVGNDIKTLKKCSKKNI